MSTFPSVSDHSHIVLYTDEQVTCVPNRGFKFESKWFREPNLREVVEQRWMELSSSSLVDRLYEVSVCLQKWGRGLNVNFRKELQSCNAKLEQLRGRHSEDDIAEFDEFQV